MKKHQNSFTNYLIKLAFCCLALSLVACGGGSDSSSEPDPEPIQEYVYRIPAELNDGWSVADAESLGVSKTQLETIVRSINNNIQDFKYIDALAVIKDGQLILDEEFKTDLDFTDDWSNNSEIDLHVLNSVTKSYVSTLVGIAIDQGLIESVDVLVHDYFPEYQPVANWDDRKANVTLRNWLTMRHGYDWDEWSTSYFDSANDNYQMNNYPIPVKFLLDRPLVVDPGTDFNYSTGVSYAIGRIVQKATGMNIHTYMFENLFVPLDIDRYTYWSLDGQIHMGSALYLTNRDMAKLGQLFLDQGQWNGRQIISPEWVAESTAEIVNEDGFRYGYQWWLTTYTSRLQNFEAYFASGLGGQYIFVFPQLNAVVAFHGAAYTDIERSGRNVRRILEDFILPELID